MTVVHNSLRPLIQSRIFWLLCLISHFCLVQAVTGQTEDRPDWNSLRGNNFDGHSAETGIVHSWSSDGPPVLWTRKLGQGYSGFTGKADRIFTQFQTAVSQYVVCLDRNDGKTIWKYGYDWSYKSAGLYPGPRATPTLDDDKLYYTSPSGKLGCLKQENGSLLWEVNFVEQFDAKPIGFGYACSPLVVNDLVIIPVGGKDSSVVAFNKLTGKVVWRAGDDEISYASILPVTRNERRLLVAYLKNALLLLDQNSGELLSRKSISNGYDEHSAWPIYSEPYLWVSAPFRKGSRLFKLSDGDTPELETVWGRDAMSNDVASSVLVDGSIFGFDIYDVQSKVHRPSRGQFRCIDFLTGKSKWENGSKRERRKIQSADDVPAEQPVGHSSVIHADGKLILFNDTGELILLAANPNKFDLLARASVLGGEICWTQPMLLDRRLYLRNQTQVVCLYLGDPNDLKQQGKEILSLSDIPQSSYFDLASLIFSIEPEYAMDAPPKEWLIHWYWIMLIGGWAVAFPIALGTTAILFRNSTTRHRDFYRRLIYRALGIAIGIFGTTLISNWSGEFVFTWPLVLMLVFESLVYQTRMGSRKQSASGNENLLGNRWTGRVVALLFIATCIAYFYLCRRLSLAFEWSFLLGFPAAIPFLLGAAAFARRLTSNLWIVEWLLTAIAFSAFYWLGAAVILWKYF